MYLCIYLQPKYCIPSQSFLTDCLSTPPSSSAKVGPPWVSLHPGASSLFRTRTHPLHQSPDKAALLGNGYCRQGIALGETHMETNCTSATYVPAPVCPLVGGSFSEKSQVSRLVDFVILPLVFLSPFVPSVLPHTLP